MVKVVTFGEVMLRLATMRRERFTQAREFEVTYGGGECNFAVSLAQFGVDATFVSAIPDNDIGQACVNYIRQFGVDTSEILRQGKRLGTYYTTVRLRRSLRSSPARSTGRRYSLARTGSTSPESPLLSRNPPLQHAMKQPRPPSSLA